MPGTDVIAVIALTSVAGRTVSVSHPIPIIKIINGARYQIFMITGDRVGVREQSTPRRCIIIGKTVDRRGMAKISQDQCGIGHLIDGNLRGSHLLACSCSGSKRITNDITRRHNDWSGGR